MSTVYKTRKFVFVSTNKRTDVLLRLPFYVKYTWCNEKRKRVGKIITHYSAKELQYKLLTTLWNSNWTAADIGNRQIAKSIKAKAKALCNEQKWQKFVPLEGQTVHV